MYFFFYFVGNEDWKFGSNIPLVKKKFCPSSSFLLEKGMEWFTFGYVVLLEMLWNGLYMCSFWYNCGRNDRYLCSYLIIMDGMIDFVLLW